MDSYSPPAPQPNGSTPTRPSQNTPAIKISARLPSHVIPGYSRAISSYSPTPQNAASKKKAGGLSNSSSRFSSFHSSHLRENISHLHTCPLLGMTSPVPTSAGKERLAHFQARRIQSLRSIHNLHTIYGELTGLECVLGKVEAREDAKIFHPI